MIDIKILLPKDPLSYAAALSLMEEKVHAVIQKKEPEVVWFLEHCPVYTLGTSGQENDVLNSTQFPVFKTNRGGRSTYHGPGQRIVYLILDLKKRCPDIRHFVWSLEEWLLKTLSHLGVEGFRRQGRIGIWVLHPEKGEAKIAALGLRVRQGVSFHGISLNVCPDLSHYQGIIPCGIQEYPVTSLQDLGIDVSMETVDDVLKTTLESVLFPCLFSRPQI